MQKIAYSITDSPLGYLLLAATEKGICSVRFGNAKKALEREVKKEFPTAEPKNSDKYLRQWIKALTDYLSGHKPWPLLPYDVQATAFQKRVWDWLRTIPTGSTFTYSEAAKAMGQPAATRTVARACATNSAALVIPCHRIVPKSGGVGGYRWNPKRKQQLLQLEREDFQRKIRLGAYQHYKGPLYKLIGIAKHSETEEDYAVYKTLYKNKSNSLWIRPLKMFLENVIIDGKTIPRFQYQKFTPVITRRPKGPTT